jgi:hypothetical protein
VALCRVSYRDIEGIEHSVEVDAGSLYEAVAAAVKRFRNDDGWAMSPPGSACKFEVRVLPHSPITYSISLHKVQNFALQGTAKGPQDILRKKQIRRVARAQLVRPLAVG